MPQHEEADLPEKRVSRAAWWLSLALFLGGVGAAYWIHKSGLSFWLRRVDWWYTSGAILIAGLSLGVFVIASRGRMNDMRAPRMLLWLLPVFPIWVLFMGLVPGATDAKPDPIRTTLRQLGVVLVVGSVLAAVLAAVVLWRGQSSIAGVDTTEEALGGSTRITQ